MVPYQISAMNLSTIVDVFPYFQDEVDQPLPPHLKRIEPEETEGELAQDQVEEETEENISVDSDEVTE